MQHALPIVFIINAICLNAQPAIQWQRSFGGSNFEEGYSVQQTRDGGFITLALTASQDLDVFGAHGGYDFFVVKLDANGQLEWKHPYGGTGHDYPYTIEQTIDGGYIMAGYTRSNNVDVSGNHGDKDAWIVKLDSLGVIEWQRCYGGTWWEEAHAVRQTSDGGYIFAGIAGSNDGDVSGVYGDLDYWVVKLTATGMIEWQHAYGGTKEDMAHDIRQTSDGGYIVAGKVTSNDGAVEENYGSEDYWVLKLNTNGNLEWKKNYGGSGAEICEEIRQTSDGGYIMNGYASKGTTGQVTGHHGGVFDFWVVKIDSLGVMDWQRALGGSELDYGRSICELKEGGYVACGSTFSIDGDATMIHGMFDAWIVKLNASGEVIWQRSLGGTQPDVGYSIQQTTDGGLIMTGLNWSTDGDATECKGYDDLWLVKLAPESSPTSTPTLTPQLTLFPNPATDQVFLEAPASPLRVRVCDLLGRVCLSTTLAPGEPLVLPGLAPGIYTVYATDESGQLYSGKLLKE